MSKIILDKIKIRPIRDYSNIIDKHTTSSYFNDADTRDIVTRNNDKTHRIQFRRLINFSWDRNKKREYLNYSYLEFVKMMMSMGYVILLYEEDGKLKSYTDIDPEKIKMSKYQVYFIHLNQELRIN